MIVDSIYHCLGTDGATVLHRLQQNGTLRSTDLSDRAMRTEGCSTTTERAHRADLEVAGCTFSRHRSPATQLLLIYI
jgi:hypothetical protein